MKRAKKKTNTIGFADLLEAQTVFGNERWFGLKSAWISSVEPELYEYLKSSCNRAVEALISAGIIEQRGAASAVISIYNLLVTKFLEGFTLGERRRAKIDGDDTPLGSFRKPKPIDGKGGLSSTVGPECLDP